MNKIDEIYQATLESEGAKKKVDYYKIKLEILQRKSADQEEAIISMIRLYSDKWMDQKSANELTDYLLKCKL